jgi:hypothetical protein
MDNTTLPVSIREQWPPAGLDRVARDNQRPSSVSSRDVRVATPLYALSRARNVMKTLLATAALVIVGAVTVQAADIPPVTAHWTKLGERASALVYYIDEPDGFHVVVATEQGTRKKAAALTFETVLAAGQSAEVAVPPVAGKTWAQIVLSNAGNHLQIVETALPLPPSDLPQD